MDMDGYGWIWMDMDGYGWIWMDLDGFGWIWMALDRFGWILSISTEHIIDNLCRLGKFSINLQYHKKSTMIAQNDLKI